MPDRFASQDALLSSGLDFIAVTKSDVTDFLTDPVLQLPKALYVGGYGDLVVQGAGGVTVTFFGVAAGTILPIRPRKVMAATTASNIVAIL